MSFQPSLGFRCSTTHCVIKVLQDVQFNDPCCCLGTPALAIYNGLESEILFCVLHAYLTQPVTSSRPTESKKNGSRPFASSQSKAGRSSQATWTRKINQLPGLRSTRSQRRVVATEGLQGWNSEKDLPHPPFQLPAPPVNGAA